MLAGRADHEMTEDPKIEDRISVPGTTEYSYLAAFGPLSLAEVIIAVDESS